MKRLGIVLWIIFWGHWTLLGGDLPVFKTESFTGVLKSLYSFSADNWTGAVFRTSCLVQGPDGNFFGTYGGNNVDIPNGIIFKLSSSGSMTAIYSFTGCEDGATPVAGVTLGNDGFLYGVTEGGGLNGCGTVFQISTSGSIGWSVSLGGDSNGIGPEAALVQGLDGAFYGTTQWGGDCNCGTLFKVTKEGAFTTLHSFTGNPDGIAPLAGLVSGSDGSLYGMTSAGGAFGCGTVFKLTANGEMIILHSFDWTDGANPRAALVWGNTGDLYGTTADGGGYGVGTIYKITSTGVFTLIYDSFNWWNGAHPESELCLGIDGNFYGTIEWGGTGIFKITPSGQFTPVYTFNWSDGAYPATGLIQGTDGWFYGMTTSGGTAGNGGTLFKMSPAYCQVAVGQAYNYPVSASGNPKFSATISGTDLSVFGFKMEPYSGLIHGTPTQAGTFNFCLSAVNSSGTSHAMILMEVFIPMTVDTSDLQSIITTLHEFQGTDGANPQGGLIAGLDGNLYGVTSTGGIAGAGTIFQISTSGSFNSIYSFNGEPGGANPFAGLVQGGDGLFYGTTCSGGDYNMGTLYSLRVAGSQGALTLLHSFAGAPSDGSNPMCGLVPGDNGVFYGTTTRGGAKNVGTIYSVDATGATGLLHSFGFDCGGYFPGSALVMGRDGAYYGTTRDGGYSNDDGGESYGVFYKIGMDGTFTLLYTFDGWDGYNTNGPLVQGDDGFFYGTNELGGSMYGDGQGSIFKVSPDGQETKMICLKTSDSNRPDAGVISGNDGFLYGTFTSYKNHQPGSVFKISTTGSLSTLYSFLENTVNTPDYTGKVNSHGVSPDAPLFLGSDGAFYGTTPSSNDRHLGTLAPDYGTVFRITRPAAFLKCGLPWSYQIKANNNPTRYEMSGLPAEATLDEAGWIHWTPTLTGTYNARLSVLNATGTASALITLLVQNSPELSLTNSVVTIPSGASFQFQIPANNDSCNYAVSGALPTGLVLNPNTGLISGTPSEVGTFNLRVSASNGVGTGTAQLTLDINEPLQFVSINGQSWSPVPLFIGSDQGGGFSLQMNVTNPSGNPILYSMGAGAPKGARLDQKSGLFQWTPVLGQAGVSSSDYVIQVTAQDAVQPSMQVTRSFKITVNHVDSVPKWQEIPAQVAVPGRLLSFTAIATDVDVSAGLYPVSALNYTLAPGSQGSIDAATGVYTWTVPNSWSRSEFNLTLQVSKCGKDEQTLSVPFRTDLAGPILQSPRYLDVAHNSNGLLTGFSVSYRGSLFVSASSSFGVRQVEFFDTWGGAKTSLGICTQPTNSGVFSAPWPVDREPPGPHTIEMVATDCYGLVSSTLSVTGSLQLPRPEPPVISTPASTTALKQILVSGTAQPGGRIQCYQNGVSSGIGAVDGTGFFTLPLTLSGTGTNDLYAVAINQTGTSGKSNHLTVTLDYSKPSSPLGLTATAIAGGKVRLVWQQPASGAASRYTVLRSLSDGMISGTSWDVSNTMVVDAPPLFSGTCHYWVAAVGTNGVAGDWSNEAAAVPDAQAPSALSLTYSQVPGGSKIMGERFGAGWLLVTATMSKSTAAMPQLFYTINGSSIGVNLVPVSSDNLTYCGSMQIPDINGTATAVLSARDAAGNVGHGIGAGGQIVIRGKGPTLQAEGTGIPHYFKMGDSPFSFPVLFDEPVQTGSDGLFVSPTFYLKNSGTASLLATGSLSATAVVQSSDDGRLWMVFFDAIPDTGLAGELLVGYHAVDDFENEIESSSSCIAVYSDTAPLLARAPTQLTAVSGSGGSVVLSWQPVDSAAGYNVYRGTGFGGGDVLINTGGLVTGSTVWVDVPKQDGNYSYGVTSVRVAGNDLFESPRAIVTAVSVSNPPPAVSGTPSCSMAGDGSGIQVEWEDVRGMDAAGKDARNVIPTSASPGGDDIPGVLLSYNLYRSMSDGADPVLVSSSLSLTHAIDPHPDPVRPYYIVRVVDGYGNISAASRVGGPAFSGSDLLPVSTLSVVVDHDAVPRLDWTWLDGCGYDGFDIYRVDSSGSTLLISASASSSHASYADLDYVKGSSPIYSVVPFHRDGCIKGIPRSITLPQVSVTAAPGNQILQGVMNHVGFTVQCGPTTPIQNARLKISGAAVDMYSPWFSLPANSGTDINVVVPGSLEPPFTVTLVSTPQVGETISISNEITIPVVPGGLGVQVQASNFTRGGSASAQFLVSNPGNEPVKLLLATPGGASPDIRFKVLDQNGGLLATVPFSQTNQSGNIPGNTGAIFSSADGTFLTLPPNGSFLTGPVDLPIPSTASDRVTVRLELDRVYGTNGLVLPVALSSQRTFTTIQTAYSGAITGVTFNHQSILEGSAIDVSSSDQTVLLSGSASYRESALPAQVPLVLAVSVNGFERDYNISTGPDGSFTFNFKPDPNERGGIYSVWVRHPDVQDTTPQRIFILSRVTSEYGLYQLITPNNVEQTLPVRVYTGHGTVVRNLTLVCIGSGTDGGALPEGVTVSTGTIPVIAEDSTVMTDLRFRYTGPQLAKPFSGKLFFKLVSDESPGWQTVELDYQVVNSTPVLQVTPGFVETGIQVSSTSTHSDTQTVVLSNIGQGALEDVSVSLQGGPGWMNLLSNGMVGRIEAGASRSVTLYFNPQINQAVNDYSAKLVIQSSNAPKKELPLRVSLTQSGVGDALVHVGDIYSTQSNGLAGAAVVLESEFTDPNTLTGGVTQSGSTDATGQIFFQSLPAGWYRVRVSADQHNSTVGRLCVVPQSPGMGGAAYLDVNLPYSTVSLSWSVVPVELQDEYNIVLNATYETKVPAPVVVVDPPSFNLPDLSKGDQFNGQITLTNMGLLAANQLTFTKPSDDAYFKYELLNPVPSTLEAGQMVVVAYRIICIAQLGGQASSLSRPAGFQPAAEDQAGSPISETGWKPIPPGKKPIPQAGIGCWTYSNCFTEKHLVRCLWNPALNYWATNYVCTGKSDRSCPTVGNLGAGGVEGGGKASIWQFLGSPDGGGPAVIPPGQSLPTVVGQKCFPPPPDCQSAPSPLRKNDCDDPASGPACEGPANWNAKSSWVNLPSREYRDEVNDLTLVVPGGKIDVGRRYTSKSGQWKWMDYNLSITANPSPGYKVCGIVRGQTRFTPAQLCPPAGTDSTGDFSVFYNDWQSKTEKIVVTYNQASISKLRWSDHTGFWCDYDSTGKITEAGIRDLTVAHYWYDDQGRLKTIGNGTVSYASFVYTGAHLDRVSDAMGRSVSYGYDGSGFLVSCTHSYNAMSSITESYSYDSQGRMTGKTTGKGTFNIGYDSAGYVHSISDAGGGTMLFDFDYEQLQYYARIIDADGKGTERTFDSTGRLTLEKVDGVVTQTLHYDGVNQTLADAQGRITTQVYDENNNLIRETLPDGGTTLSSFDPVSGRLLRKQDPQGAVTTYQYDGELVSITEAEGSPLARTTTYSGYDQHRPTHEVDSMGIVTDTRYLPNAQGGETVQITVTGTDQWPVTRSMELDLAGNRVASTDALGQRTEFVRDERGRVLSETNLVSGLSTINRYDGWDLVQVEVGRCGAEPGRITKYNYDAMHRRIATILVGDNGVQTVQQRLDYNAAGRLVAETDALGNVTRYGYDTHGNQLFVQQNGETISSQVFDAADRRIEIDSPTGAFGTQVTRMTYDFAGRLLTRTTGTGADQRTVTHVYQPGGLLSDTLYTGSGGTFGTHYDYDLLGRRISVSGDVELPSTTHYNQAGQIDWMLDGNGNPTHFGYDGFGRPSSQTRGSGAEASTTRTFYDANGGLVKTIDGAGNTLYFKLDSQGRCTDQSVPTLESWGPGWETNPLKRSIHVTYDAWGNVLASLDAAGGTTSARYDRQGRPLQSTDKNGLSLQSQIDPLGRVSQVNYPPVSSAGSGSSTAIVYQYDPIRPDWLVAVIDRAGSVTRTIYDHPSGLKLAEVNALGGTTCYTYDSLGRTASVTDPAGNATWYFYDQFDRLTQIESPDGTVESRDYDSFGHLLGKQIGPIGPIGLIRPMGLMSYDAAGNRLSMTDGNQSITQWSYDSQNRLQTKTYADGHRDDYTYDGNGNIATRTDGKRQETDYWYNSFGQPVTIVYPNDPAVGFAYDVAGRMVQMTDATGTTSFGYSPGGLLLSQSVGARLLTYEYDVEGHRLSLSSGTGPGMSQTRSTYDPAGRLEKVFDSRVSPVPFQYGWSPGTGQIDHLIMPSGAVQQKRYDPSGRLTGISLKSGTRTINDFSYDYNSVSQRGGEQDHVSGNSQVFHYDSQRQLTGVDSANPEGFTYDPIGNWLTHTSTIGTGTFTVNCVNQYTAVLPPGGSTPFSPVYDANGNLIDNGNGTTYIWDDANHLKVVQTAQNRVEFQTNGLGWRVQKRVYDVTAQTLQGSTRFIYDGANLLEELDDSPFTTNQSPSLKRAYTHGLDLSLSQEGAGGIGGILCVTLYNSSPVSHFYPGFDGNGNILDWVDDSGAVQAHFNYLAFGKIRSRSGTAADMIPLRWSSKYQDDETGLLYFGNRYYAPSLGRWISRDPIEESGGTNLYGYCGNEPIGRLDFNGLWGTDVHLYSTERWAIQVGYPGTAASLVAQSDEAVDGGATGGGNGFAPWGDQSYHFDRNRGVGVDTRKQHFSDHFRSAIEDCNGLKDDPITSAKELGTSLHSYQDWIAHGDYGFNTTGSIWRVHNSLSNQTGFGDPSGYPDDTRLDAVGGVDGRASGAAMHVIYNNKGVPIGEIAVYTRGNIRYRKTNEMTKDVLSQFLEAIKKVKNNCKCRKYFGIN